MHNHEHQTPEPIVAAFAAVVRYRSAQNGAQPMAEQLARYNAARDVLRADVPAAARYLATQFDGSSFVHKQAAYDMLVMLGTAAAEPIRDALAQQGAITQLWLVSTLHAQHDLSEAPRMVALLDDPAPYVRYLAALALVFQGLSAQADADRLMTTLLDALLSDEAIEGSAFNIADSALSCITLLTGERWTPAQQAETEFYNFNAYVFPPPVLPFPFTSDRITQLSPDERRALHDRIAAWWQQNRDRVQFRPVPSCFDR